MSFLVPAFYNNRNQVYNIYVHVNEELKAQAIIYKYFIFELLHKLYIIMFIMALNAILHPY